MLTDDEVHAAIAKLEEEPLDFCKMTRAERSDERVQIAAICTSALAWLKHEHCERAEIVEDMPSLTRKVALLACVINGYELASCRLKGYNDDLVTMAAITSRGAAIADASIDAQHNRDIVLEAVSADGTALEYCPAFQDDEGVVSAAVQQNESAVLYASERLKNGTLRPLVKRLKREGI